MGTLPVYLNNSATTTPDQCHDLRIVVDGANMTVWRGPQGEQMTEVLSSTALPAGVQAPSFPTPSFRNHTVKDPRKSGHGTMRFINTTKLQPVPLPPPCARIGFLLALYCALAPPMAMAQETVYPVREFGLHISDGAFSPDGSQLFVAHSGRTSLLDMASGETRLFFNGEAGSVTSVAFSPDGAQLLTGGDRVTLWDAATGAEIRIFAESMHSVQFAAEGSQVVAFLHTTMKIWDAATGVELLSFVPAELHGTVISVALSPDGTRLVTGGVYFPPTVEGGPGDIAEAILWDVATGEKLRILFERAASVTSVAFSPDSMQVFTSSNKAELWDAGTGVLLSTFASSGDWVAFTLDGSQVLFGGSGGAGLWDTATGDLTRPYASGGGYKLFCGRQPSTHRPDRVGHGHGRRNPHLPRAWEEGGFGSVLSRWYPTAHRVPGSHS